MIDIKYLIKDFINVMSNGGTLQDFINNRYKTNDYMIGKYATHVKINNDFLIPISQYGPVVEEVFTEYDYSDLRPTDIVLDIGAHIGIFSLNVSKKVKNVYAIEPIFFLELCDNILQNQKTNVLPLNVALSPETIRITFDGRSRIVPCMTLTQLKEVCGGHVDFLKCDCEGGEWCIKPEELEGIRRIEMEVHSFNGENYSDMIKMLRDLNYDIWVQPRDKFTILVHATKK